LLPPDSDMRSAKPGGRQTQVDGRGGPDGKKGGGGWKKPGGLPGGGLPGSGLPDGNGSEGGKSAPGGKGAGGPQTTIPQNRDGGQPSAVQSTNQPNRSREFPEKRQPHAGN
jgi:hypothetical protein